MTPVRINIIIAKISPKPGIVKPSRVSGRHSTGSKSKSRSIKSSRNLMTSTVIPSGTHTNKPATRYRRNMTFSVGRYSCLPELLLEPWSLWVRFFCLLDLKSVSYQPLPLSLNPAADTTFFNASALHEGHVVSGASAIFCNASCR